MANLFPSIFPYSPDSDEMKKLGIQTEFKIYEKLGSIFDETVDVFDWRVSAPTAIRSPAS